MYEARKMIQRNNCFPGNDYNYAPMPEIRHLNPYSPVMNSNGYAFSCNPQRQKYEQPYHDNEGYDYVDFIGYEGQRIDQEPKNHRKPYGASDNSKENQRKKTQQAN
jgi:hypothetical protein